MGNKPWRYAVVLDAGSSGTRAHVYRWLHPTYAREHADAPALHSLPEIHTKHKWTKKTKPGLSSFAASPEELGPNHLQQLLEHVLKVVPDEAVPETPIFLLATAGMRLLPEAQRTALLDSTCTYIRTHSRFQLPECARSVQVIDGATEGLYGWLATNYLVGSFDDTIKPPHTYGFLDMG
ncbi:Golgi apyrase, partial [Ascosphaera atra]